MDGNDIGPITYESDYKHIIPTFELSRKINAETYTKETIYSRPDAVFYAKTKYHEGNKHIDEFNADVCIKCIKTYDKLEKYTHCVSD